jgi:hypothetical protein
VTAELWSESGSLLAAVRLDTDHRLPDVVVWNRMIFTAALDRPRPMITEFNHVYRQAFAWWATSTPEGT